MTQLVLTSCELNDFTGIEQMVLLYSCCQLKTDKKLERREVVIIQQYQYLTSVNILHVWIHSNLFLPPQTVNFYIFNISITTTNIHIETEIIIFVTGMMPISDYKLSDQIDYSSYFNCYIASESNS
ncbi:Hypothetical_protein [Hexamita inflata]|uniref:Hypothetical_protein n=1 Tax=Hexamita inflata TaxID=28002 RepID=A0AA86UJ06_9EUKA|nr:Hypothetical protein HINF_LOCUS47820 [Hexamita inflata]